jgi:LacI family transcriptional regulator
MRDVATRAGVSQTTVSLVLNNTETTNIPDATRAKVFAAARDLGYRIDASATRTLGLITDEIASGPYAGEIIGGAQDAAWDAGHVLLVVNTGGRPDVERAAVEVMLERNVDGVIFT